MDLLPNIWCIWKSFLTHRIYIWTNHMVTFK